MIAIPRISRFTLWTLAVILLALASCLAVWVWFNAKGKRIERLIAPTHTVAVMILHPKNTMA
jgi:hypothetical protein